MRFYYASKVVKCCKMEKKFLCLALQSPFIQSQIKSVTTKVGQPKLAIKRIENFIVPVPPLMEQHRIVAKIGELLPLCQQLAANPWPPRKLTVSRAPIHHPNKDAIGTQWFRWHFLRRLFCFLSCDDDKSPIRSSLRTGDFCMPC